MVHLNIIRALSPMKQPATNLCLDLERLLMFFIVIDDIWDSKVWNIIKCALLDNNHGSRVITTTRILNVATETGDIYKLKPLSQHLSEELLYTRLFGGKDKCPFDQPAEVSRIFLQKCGGVPLAIITIASLLAGKPMKNWSKVFKSIGFGSGDNNTDVENTRKILSFSYYDLPCYLRPCLLHLSIYPEDYLIMKDKLIWQWVAEGFVNEEPGEQNFVAILDSNEEHTPSQCNARRLAVQKRVVPLANMSMPKLRSCDPSAMPSLSNFQVLRVLAMEKCGFERDRPYHLEHLGRLSQLRYLSLESACIRKLPEEIGDLKILQTLDLRDTYIKELPQSIGLLRKLKCLRADTDGVGITVPNWIGNLTSLEELHLCTADKSSIFVQELSKLTELRVLVCKLTANVDECWIKTFVESLCNLRKIQVLPIELLDCFQWPRLMLDDHWKGYEPPRQLRDLEIEGGFSRLPTWINSSLLPNLSNLNMGVDEFGEQDVVNLGSLQELTCVGKQSIPRGMEFPDGAFPKLRSSKMYAPFRFLQGSMQSLESIVFTVEDVENLPSLQRVHASIRRDNAYVCDIDKASAAVRQAIGTHPNRPTLNLRAVFGPRLVIDDDKEDEEKLDSEQKEQEPHSHDDDNHPVPHLTESSVDAAGTSPPPRFNRIGFVLLKLLSCTSQALLAQRPGV
uniref:Disease resistance protein RPM1 n=1 Tax=Aegilops tauschii TaxID=37682 RepID=R7WCQ7_AEGTA